MHRGPRPDDPDESVTDRMRRLEAALKDIRKQTSKMLHDGQRAREAAEERRRPRAASVSPKKR